MPMIKMRDGSSVFVRILGRGQPVVMLHGFAMDSRHWLPFIAPHLNHYRFIMPDFRGHGASCPGILASDTLLDTLCADLDTILDQLKVERALLCAYSMGAMVGLEYVLKRQLARIERYMHIEMSPRFHNSSDWSFGFDAELKKQAIQLMELWIQQSEQASLSYRALIHEMVLQAFPQRWVKRMVGAVPPRLIEPMLPDAQFTLETFRFLLESDFDVRALIPDLKIPGLIISGRQSRYFPWEGSDWMHKNWVQSRHLVFEDSGHGLMYSEPFKFRKAFQCFLEGDIERVHDIRPSGRWLRVRPAG